MRLLISMQDRYPFGARVGLMRGAPYRKSQVSVSAKGCATVQLCPPPTIMCTPKARRLCCRQSPTQVTAPTLTQSHSTSNFQISDCRSQTSGTRVVRMLGGLFVARRTLSRNCARLNHMVPLVQYTYPSSDRFSVPRSRSLFPPFFTPPVCADLHFGRRRGPPWGC